MTLFVHRVAGLKDRGFECLTSLIRLAPAVQYDHESSQCLVVSDAPLSGPVTHQIVDRLGHAPDDNRLVGYLMLDHYWLGPIHLGSPPGKGGAPVHPSQQCRDGLVPAGSGEAA